MNQMEGRESLAGSSWSIHRWGRVARFAPGYLRSVVRRERQLVLLALGGLAPGVAVLTAWLNLAHHLREVGVSTSSHAGWLLPEVVLVRLGLGGVLVGAGVVTLLIGGLGLANAYLASVERRTSQLALLQSSGLNRREVSVLLVLEATGAGLLGSGAGLFGGLILSPLSWTAAGQYFGFDSPYRPDLLAIVTAQVAGFMAALLFMGTTAIASIRIEPGLVLRGQSGPLLLRSWRRRETIVYGTLYALALVLVAGLPVLPANALILLSGLTGILGLLLNSSGWLLTWLYDRLPAPVFAIRWRLALQGLARYPRHTAGLTLAMITGAYAVGLAALATSDGIAFLSFPAWVAGGILVAGGVLVLTAASLAALERRQELGLFVALGGRPSRVRKLMLLEYSIVAVCGGSLGASLALVNWAWAGGGNWVTALLIAFVDLVATVIAAWAGALPVLWRLGRRPPNR
ncbi:MAG: hypothetical protein OXH98_20660 [Caldilineaceae bacterium]|nr:hypothetical protein [Caldilineaceae bacterium]